MNEEELTLKQYITKEQALHVIATHNCCDKMTLACYDALISEVYDLPAAEVRENVRGEWEIEYEPDGAPYCLHCSVCDQEWARIDITSFYNYCPICGAKMRGKTDE